jgi:hypothetical protein
MPAERGGCKKIGWFGCFGCLGLLMIVVVTCAVVFGIASSMARNEQIEHRVLTQLLPSAESSAVEGSPTLVLESPPAAAGGKVILDLEGTFFEIKPAAPGEPMRVEAEFDANTYDLKERFQESLGDEGWVYEVEFGRPSRSYGVTLLKEVLTDSRPEVTIFLPRNIPFDLEFRIAQGGSELELGGLNLGNADIEFAQGGGLVEFSEPLARPMDSLAVHFTQGGGAIDGAGNASPRRLDVVFSMGGGFVGLEGAWRNDSDISLRQLMGAMSVQLPSNATIRGIPRPGFETPSDAEVPLPVLRLRTSKQYGDIEILD